MAIIGLIRHGMTEWNDLGKAQGHFDIPLNESGRQEAIMLGDRLLQEGNWDIIVSSDLSRAVETASIIGSKLKLPIKLLEKRIREINCGLIEGMTEEERVEKWGMKWRDLDLGMEKYKDVALRSMEFINETAMMHKGKKVLLVSHGAVIGLTLQYLFPQQFPSTYIENASLTILEKGEDSWACNLYNCTKHLDTSLR